MPLHSALNTIKARQALSIPIIALFSDYGEAPFVSQPQDARLRMSLARLSGVAFPPSETLSLDPPYVPVAL